MSHPFGDLLSQHLHRRHHLSQSMLAAGVMQDPSVIGRMCKGRRLSGPHARERVLAVIDWLHAHTALENIEEANALLAAAGMSPLRIDESLASALPTKTQHPLVPEFPKPAGSVTKTNLPVALTSFIGRGRETMELAQQITLGRLVTITGAGGVGKTRLATEVGVKLMSAGSPSAHPDGIWMVELAALPREPAGAAQIPKTIAGVFRLSARADRSMMALLEEYLADKHLLLILDNCEHLVDTCAETAQRLLQRCWNVRILATSREALGIPGEVTYPLLPLRVPEPGEKNPERLLDCPAARLFVDRTGAPSQARITSEEDVNALADICRKLDGIPLALELAAPLAESLTLGQIAAQLHDQMAILSSTYRTAIPRHQTMLNALAWSYHLLSEAERRLLARLSVFAGGWTLEAGRAIRGEDTQADIAVALRQLVSKSLVLVEQHASGKRFRLLEPVRQFAHAQLVARDGLSETRRQHANYFLSLAEEMDRARDHPAEREWLLSLEPERENLRLANAWALENNEAEFAHRFNGALFAFWLYCSSAAEARRSLESALALTASAPTPAALSAEAAARDTAGHVAVSQGEYTLGQAHFERELVLYRQLGDPRGIATGLRGCGFTAMHRGELERAKQFVEESLAVSQAAQDHSGCAWSVFDLGYLALVRGDLGQAQQLLDASALKFREQSNLFGLHRALFALARVRDELGDTARARSHYRDGLELQQKMRYLQVTADALEGLAGIFAREGKPDRAARLFGAAHTHRATMAIQRWEHTNGWYERDLALAHSQIDQHAWNTLWESGSGLDQEQAVAFALAILQALTDSAFDGEAYNRDLPGQQRATLY